MHVWFNGRISASQAEGAGSIPVTCSILNVQHKCLPKRRGS